MKEYMDRLDYPIEAMENLGVQSFSSAIHRFKMNIKALYDAPDYKLKDYRLKCAISTILAFNYRHVADYGFVKGFQDIADKISVVNFSHEGKNVHLYLINDEPPSIAVVNNIVESMIDAICTEANRIDH